MMGEVVGNREERENFWERKQGGGKGGGRTMTRRVRMTKDGHFFGKIIFSKKNFF